MKELVTLVSCDWCYHDEEGSKVEATTTPPLTLGPRVRTLDLCPTHREALDRTRALLQAKGTKVTPTHMRGGNPNGRADQLPL